MSTAAKQLAVRSVVVLIIKSLGGIVRIPVFQMLGAEGVGLYQMMYSTYGLLLTIITGGYPTALALTTAGDLQRGLRFFRLSFFCLAPFAGTATVFIYVHSDRLALLFDEPRLGTAFLYLSPVLVIVPFLSLLRGFFQGIEMYGVIAMSELLEQTIRVVIMFVLISAWVKEGVYHAIGGALVGAWAGALAALLLLAVIMIQQLQNMNSEGIRPLRINRVPPGALFFFSSSFSIMTTRLIIPLAEFLDAIIIPHRLQASGLGLAQATAVYGEFAGLAASIVYFPSLLTASLSHISASKLSSDWQELRLERFQSRINKMLTIGWFWGLGSAFYLFYYHKELAVIFFHNESTATAIAFMCAAPVIVGLRELSTTILWVMEKNQQTVTGLIVGMIAAAAAGYFLIAIPEFRYIGTALELLLLEGVATLWNLRVLYKQNKPVLAYGSLLIRSLLLLGTSFLCYQLSGWITNSIGLSQEIKTAATLLFSFGVIIVLVMYLSNLKSFYSNT